MTATDELRRMLDERGIEWWSKPRLVVGGVEKGTEFDAADGSWVHAIEALDGTICVSHLTPEQAVTVTLGAGTCKADETDVIKCWVKCKDEPSTEHMELIHVMECSACGGTYEYVNGSYEYCPRCGAKVIG